MHEATVELNGVHLYTRRVGDGPAVVVLHGGPGAHHDYLLPQYDRLAESPRRRPLLYYDQRGGGQAPPSRETPPGSREPVPPPQALRPHWALPHPTPPGGSPRGLLAVL